MRSLLWLTRHWLACLNGFLLAFASLPAIEPLLRAGGISGPSEAIFAAYSVICHQMPARSYFLAGQQMAYCERNTAIYGAMALCGLLWARFGGQLRCWTFLLLCLPIALDGFTQLAALRESTWQLRTVTGGLFGFACVWFGFPLIERQARMTRIVVLSFRAQRGIRRRSGCFAARSA